METEEQLSTDINKALTDTFALEKFRPGQEKVITALLSGNNALAIFPTGAGKSLCYQLPATIFSGLTLVVSPLIALMKDQVDGLKKKGIQAERLDSSLGEKEYTDVISRVTNGKLKILFVAPERVSNERFLSYLSRQKISLLAIDEAHCISSWGHNFRPDYLKLAQKSKELQVKRILTLTATATPQVAKDIATTFQINKENVINTGFHRKNLELRITASAQHDKHRLLLDKLQQRPLGPTLVYVTLQRQAEEVAEHLANNGFSAKAYHAGMSPHQRAHVQDGFMANSTSIVCATIAFGMGIDKHDIRYIYHYHLPKGIESYMQEIGRAGRDGKSSICEIFACKDDTVTLENFVYGDTPEFASIEKIVDILLDNETEADISTYELSRNHDIRPLVINTLLTRLELMGVLRSNGFYYSDIRISPTKSNEEIIATYKGTQADFLEKMFSCCTMAKSWATLDTNKASAITGYSREVLLRALDDLKAKGLVKLKLAGYRQRLKLLTKEVNRKKVCDTLYKNFLSHEKMEIERINTVLSYIEHTGCLTSFLLKYFGEQLEDCGHCGICLGDNPAKLRENRRKLTLPNINEISKLVHDHKEALSAPRQLARFLCGITSPATSANKKLRQNSLFGRLNLTPFNTVFDLCKTQFNTL